MQTILVDMHFADDGMPIARLVADTTTSRYLLRVTEKITVEITKGALQLMLAKLESHEAFGA